MEAPEHVMSCRHCSVIRNTYASVVVCDGSNTVHYMERIEELGIIPCVTAVCGACNKISVIAYDGSCAHALGTWKQYGKFIAP